MNKTFSSLSRFRGLIAIAVLAMLTACQTVPVEKNPYSRTGTVPTTPENTKDILESIQKSHPDIHIQAELAPDPRGTLARITVRTRQRTHLVIRGFQEFRGDTALYPDCEHWFYIARAFDKKCGDGPIIGSVNTLFGDGVGIGALFDLFQLARYPFSYAFVDKADPAETRTIFREMEEKAGKLGTAHPRKKETGKMGSSGDSLRTARNE